MDNRGDNSFWNPKSINELAKAQGIDGPQSLDELVGAVANLWASDEEFESFLDSIDRHRKGASAA